MTIDIFTCFRKIYGLNLEFHAYLIFRRAYIRGGGLYSGFYGMLFEKNFVLIGSLERIRL